MRNKLLTLWITIGLSPVLFSNAAFAQVEDGFQPLATNVPNAEYPRISDDSRIQFQIKAPDAQKISVKVGAAPDVPMTKGADGVWSATTGPIVPGFHYYYFNIDGVTVDDPASYTYFGVGKDSTGSMSRRRESTSTRSRMSRTAKCARPGITPTPRIAGGISSSTLLPITIRI